MGPNAVSILDGKDEGKRGLVLFQCKYRTWRYGIPKLKIRRSRDPRILNIGIPILVRRHLYIETVSVLLFQNIDRPSFLVSDPCCEVEIDQLCRN